MKLIPIQYSGVTKVSMKNKPSMAIALENPKIRDYPVSKRNENSYIVVDWLLNFLGVGGTKVDNKLHHVETFNFINSARINKFTYQEIKEAFEMYVAGELPPDILIAQQLNPLVLGKVMVAYEKIKRERLTAYYSILKKQREAQATEMTEDQKKEIIENGIIDAYDYFKRSNNVENGRIWIYEWLHENKLTEEIADGKHPKYVLALENLKDQAKSSGNITEYKDIVRNLQDKTYAPVLVELKKEIIKTYFRKLLLGGSSIQQELRKLNE